MPHLAFCANCGSDQLRIGARTSKGIEVSCYKCTKSSILEGIILGEVDFLAGAKTKIDAMVAGARERAQTIGRRS